MCALPIFCSTHAVPIFHTVIYAIGCGLPTMAAVTIYSVEGIGGLGGRVLFGVLADRIGVKTALIIGLTTQALGAGAYIFARDLGNFYLIATIFGAARSEEHTSELQSLMRISYAVFCLKKKKQ